MKEQKNLFHFLAAWWQYHQAQSKTPSTDLSPGVHTFRVQWRSSSAGGFINRSLFATQFAAIELKR